MRLRWLTSPRCRVFAGLICIAVFIYTRISDDEVLSGDAVDYYEKHQFMVQDNNIRQNVWAAPPSHCQIIYILGVEGSIHHGFTPILHSLALKQTDANGQSVDVQLQPRALRAALFGRFREKRPLDDPSLVADTLRKLCPSDGKKHIIIEDSSFPCGQEGDPRGYRFPRQHSWLNMTMEEIASSGMALEHPVNLYKFVELYGQYTDIKFVVLHRPFLETVASHMDWDENVIRHSNLIRGFMLILKRFLDAHKADNGGNQFWTIVCVERLMSQFYQFETNQGMQIDGDAWNAARQNILSYLAEFLGWSNVECIDCFKTWREGSKNKVKTLKDEDLMSLLDHMKEIEGVWPPVIQDGLKEQQCHT